MGFKYALTDLTMKPKAAVLGPLRRKRAFLDGAPDVDFALFGLFRRITKAQNPHPRRRGYGWACMESHAEVASKARDPR